MFQMYAFGREGVHTITHKLNEAGHRKRSGHMWDKRGILHIIKNPVYIGKIRWREVIYEGNHEPIISEVLFNKTKELMKERVESLSGRRFDNGEERLLAGIIHCASCKSHMVGVSTRKKDRKFPYYLCNKRWSTRSCHQDYVRADLLEAAIIQDIKAMFLDEQFMARVWEEANKRLGAEKRELEARRERLELPAIDREMLSRLVDKFEEVLAEGTNPQKKHLLRQMVKKVLIHDRHTVEVWYGLPYQASVRTPGHLAPRAGLEPAT